jgi:F-type H+-transporting ATPase subunit c
LTEFVEPFQREPGCTVSGNHPLAAFHEEEVMKKAAVVVLALMALLVIAPAAFAQTAPEAAKPAINTTTIVIAIGFGVAVAAFGGGLGQGRIAAAACEGIARNPGAAGGVRAAMILGLVFVETLTLFTFALGFLLYLKL